MLDSIQPLGLLYRHNHDDRPVMFSDHHRLGAGGVTQPAEAVFGALGRRGR